MYFSKSPSFFALSASLLNAFTKVSITSDLSFARVYVSIFELKYRKEDILKILQEKKDYLRMLLAQREKSQLRIMPELMFYIDDSLDYAEKIDKLLKQ